MRRGFMVAEVAAGLLLVSAVAGAGIVMFLSLTEQTLATRTHAVAVHELRNALETLKARPDLAPEPGEHKAITLSPTIARRYPDLTITLSADGAGEAGGLLKVGAVARALRRDKPAWETRVEMLIRRPDREGGGQ